LERILEFLEQATTEPLPETLRKAIEQGYQGGDAVRLERCWVLRVPDPVLLEQEEVRSLIQERLGPQVALIRETERERLLLYLLESGVLPEIEESIDR
jgi:hypothetical protein